MKVIACVTLFIVLASAAPQLNYRNPESSAVVLRNELLHFGTGAYSYSYETSNGILGQEQGHLNNEGRSDEAIAVRGQYSYPGTDGKIYSVFYVADENGFQPQSSKISTH